MYCTFSTVGKKYYKTTKYLDGTKYLEGNFTYLSRKLFVSYYYKRFTWYSLLHYCLFTNCNEVLYIMTDVHTDNIKYMQINYLCHKNIYSSILNSTYSICFVMYVVSYIIYIYILAHYICSFIYVRQCRKYKHLSYRFIGTWLHIICIHICIQNMFIFWCKIKLLFLLPTLHFLFFYKQAIIKRKHFFCSF